jgi:hypothetical protein
MLKEHLKNFEKWAAIVQKEAGRVRQRQQQNKP